MSRDEYTGHTDVHSHWEQHFNVSSASLAWCTRPCYAITTFVACTLRMLSVLGGRVSVSTEMPCWPMSQLQRLMWIPIVAVFLSGRKEVAWWFRQASTLLRKMPQAL